MFLDIEEIRDKDNETGLKEGGGIEMSNYSASIHYNDNYNLVYIDTTKFQLFEFLVYTDLDVDLKGMTL